MHLHRRIKIFAQIRSGHAKLLSFRWFRPRYSLTPQRHQPAPFFNHIALHRSESNACRFFWHETQFRAWLRQKRRPKQILSEHNGIKLNRLLHFFKTLISVLSREGIEDNAWQKRVALGAAVSPAALAKMKQENMITILITPFVLGLLLHGSTWLGLVLNLRTDLLSLIIPKSLVARFGWPLLIKSMVANVLKCLVKVAAMVVECRYAKLPDAAQGIYPVVLWAL